MLIGYFWNMPNEYLLITALLIPILFVFSQSSLQAGLIILIYILSATSGFITSAQTFFGSSLMFSIFLWILAGIPHFLSAYFIFFIKNKIIKIFLLLFCWTIPLMFVGWANPLLALGLLFQPKKEIISDIVIHNTSFIIKDENNIYEKIKRNHELKNLLKKNKLNIFPESVAGIADDFLLKSWQMDLSENTKILLPVYLRQGDNFKNSILFITKNEIKEVYMQRIPMTYGMYNPFEKNNFLANWFGNSVAIIDNKKIGFLICFESVLLFPVIQTYLSNPDKIFIHSSVWWESKNLRNAHSNSVKLIKRLFPIQIIEVTNK